MPWPRPVAPGPSASARASLPVRAPREAVLARRGRPPWLEWQAHVRPHGSRRRSSALPRCHSTRKDVFPATIANRRSPQPGRPGPRAKAAGVRAAKARAGARCCRRPRAAQRGSFASSQAPPGLGCPHCRHVGCPHGRDRCTCRAPIADAPGCRRSGSASCRRLEPKSRGERAVGTGGTGFVQREDVRSPLGWQLRGAQAKRQKRGLTLNFVPGVEGSAIH